MIHEINDHYSLQTTKSIKPSDFEDLAYDFFKVQKKLTKEEMESKIE